MKHLLVPVDFSSAEKAGLKMAFGLAQKSRAALTLLHAYHVPLPPDQPISIMEESGQSARQELERMVEELRKEMKPIKGKGPEITLEVRAGMADDLIAEYANELKIDMIVMDTGGAKGIGDLLFGTHTAKVLGEVNCPVLIIPPEYQLETIDRIAFATDWSEADSEALKTLIEIARLFAAPIEIVHVLDMEEMNDANLLEAKKEELLGALGHENVSFTALEGEDVLVSLHTYLLRQKIHLFAMLTHDRNFWRRLLDPSLTRRMAMETEVPLLALHA